MVVACMRLPQPAVCLGSTCSGSDIKGWLGCCPLSGSLQGGGQDRLGTSWGDGFVTDPKWIQERQLADANSFFQALLQQPYAHQVVLTPHLYGESVSKTPDVGPKQWEKYAASWWVL